MSHMPIHEAWDDLRVPLVGATTGGANAPSLLKAYDDVAGTSQGVYAYRFSKTVEEELFFTAQLPHSYKIGSDLKAHIHWFHQQSTIPGNTRVVWGLEWIWTNAGTMASPGDTLGDSTVSTVEATVLAGTANKHILTPIVTMTGTGKKKSSMIIGRIFRDADTANDDWDDVAWGMELDFHFQAESFGSIPEIPT